MPPSVRHEVLRVAEPSGSVQEAALGGFDRTAVECDDARSARPRASHESLEKLRLADAGQPVDVADPTLPNALHQERELGSASQEVDTGPTGDAHTGHRRGTWWSRQGPSGARHQPVATATVTLSSPSLLSYQPGSPRYQIAVGEPEEEPGGGVGNADPAVPSVADGEGLADLRCDLRGWGAVGDVQPRRGRLGRRAVGEEYADEEHPVAAVDDARDPAERRDVGRSEPTLVAGSADEIGLVA